MANEQLDHIYAILDWSFTNEALRRNQSLLRAPFSLDLLITVASLSASMKQTGQCPKCGSKEVIADAKAIDRGDLNSEHEMSVATFETQGTHFQRQAETTVSAWACAAVSLVPC
jgi:hypothetical protein